MSRFVHPHTDILTLNNGDTLIVRRRLNVGEQRASFRACYDWVTLEDENGTASKEFRYDPTRLGLAKVAAYLVDWHLTGDATAIRDLDLAQRMALLDNLDPDDFADLKTAIDAHETRQVAARLEEKKRAATTNGDQISPSPSAAVGASSGSVSST